MLLSGSTKNKPYLDANMLRTISSADQARTDTRLIKKTQQAPVTPKKPPTGLPAGIGFLLNGPTTSNTNPDTVGGDTTELDKLREERLQAALEAIASEFAYQKGDLESQMKLLGEEYKIGKRQNERDTKDAIRQSKDQAAARGIYDSSITGDILQRAVTPLAESLAQLTAAKNPDPAALGTDIRALQSLLLLLDSQKASAEAEAKRTARADQLDVEQLIALLTAGLPTG